MTYLTPHQYLRELKELIKLEQKKIKEQKKLILEFKDYDMATLYNQIENKLAIFLEELDFKN